MHVDLQVLRDNLPTYDIGMLEQMSMVYVLKQNPEYISKLYFEHGYCFNCWYQDLDDPRIGHPAFVIHFAGAASAVWWPIIPFCLLSLPDSSVLDRLRRCCMISVLL